MEVFPNSVPPIHSEPGGRSSLLEINVRKEGENAAVLQLKGEVDSGSCPALRKAMTDLISEGYYHLVINLSEVSYFDSTGFAILIGGMRRVWEYKGTMSLVSPLPSVQRVLETSRVSQLLNIYARESEALDYCSSHQALMRSLHRGESTLSQRL